MLAPSADNSNPFFTTVIPVAPNAPEPCKSVNTVSPVTKTVSPDVAFAC